MATGTGNSGHHSGGSGSNQDSGVGTNLGSGLGSNLGLGSGDTSTGGVAPLTGLTGTGSGADPSNLFPTISPSPGATPPIPGGGSPAATTKHAPYHPTSVADVLPLNTGQVGSQVAGLVVLALGVIIAVARVSLRKPRAQRKQ